MSYFYKETLLFTIIQQNIFKARNEQLKIVYFIFTDVTEILSVYLKLITFLNFQTMYAYLIYHTFIFITPALFKLEYLYLKFILQSITTVYLISTILIHYFLLPIT
jgi:Sec-independent protein secretion pathway component TatC